jgi:hypothetical protein
MVRVRKGHIKEDLLNHFVTRNSYEENPYIKYDVFKNTDYIDCVNLADSTLSEMKKSHDKDFLFRGLDKLEAIEYRMDDLTHPYRFTNYY